MQITHIGKITEGQYTISSLPCPSCSTITTVNIDGTHLYKYNQGARVQEVLPNESLAVREAFMTGYCSPCWSDIFGSDDELGECDTCGAEYDLASRDGRCGDCGECSAHCEHDTNATEEGN